MAESNDLPHDVTSSIKYDQNGRQLSAQELAKLESDTSIVPAFTQNKLEKEAKKNWDLFYKRNETRFFKDRHWTKREFEELIGDDSQNDGDQRILLEVGCGVGNFIWPLIQEGTHFYIYACDFSPRAIELLKKNVLYDETCVKAFVCDITHVNEINHEENCDKNEDVTQDYNAISIHLPLNGPHINVVSLIFVLSAIHPDKMKIALSNIYQVLRPDGIVLFRDYGLYDHAMLRFNTGHKLGDNFYVRQDGTRAYYFTTDLVSSLFTSCGFEVISNEYIRRETVNKKQGLCVDRVFVQAKLMRRST